MAQKMFAYKSKLGVKNVKFIIIFQICYKIAKKFNWKRLEFTKYQNWKPNQYKLFCGNYLELFQ